MCVQYNRSCIFTVRCRVTFPSASLSANAQMAPTTTTTIVASALTYIAAESAAKNYKNCQLAAVLFYGYLHSSFFNFVFSSTPFFFRRLFS